MILRLSEYIVHSLARVHDELLSHGNKLVTTCLDLSVNSNIYQFDHKWPKTPANMTRSGAPAISMTSNLRLVSKMDKRGSGNRQK